MDITTLIPEFGGLIWTILAFVVALSVIVAVHEYGHYIVGRWSGIHAETFSLGFGPVIWSRVDKRGTKWQIAALPFGGYVKFLGDANAASGKDEAAMAEAATDPAELRRTMHGAPLWARAATVAAGPVFNFIMSILVFGAIMFSQGEIRDPLTVGDLLELPDGTYALQPGDEIIAIDGVAAPGFEDAEAWSEFTGTIPVEKILDYTVARDGAPAPLSIEVVRAHIVPQTITYERRGNAALFNVLGFNQSTTRNLKDKIEQAFDAQGAQLSGLIIDETEGMPSAAAAATAGPTA